MGLVYCGELASLEARHHVEREVHHADEADAWAHGEHRVDTPSARGQHAVSMWPARGQHAIGARLACCRVRTTNAAWHLGAASGAVRTVGLVTPHAAIALTRVASDAMVVKVGGPGRRHRALRHAELLHRDEVDAAAAAAPSPTADRHARCCTEVAGSGEARHGHGQRGRKHSEQQRSELLLARGARRSRLSFFV